MKPTFSFSFRFDAGNYWTTAAMHMKFGMNREDKQIYKLCMKYSLRVNNYTWQ
jgi:hypothetical protein